MKKLTGYLNTALEAAGAVALVLMMLHVVLNAVLRQYFRTPIYGSNEMVTYWYMPAIALLGIVVAYVRREHISVSLIYDRLKPGNKRDLRILGDVLGVTMSAAFTWFGLLEAIDRMQKGTTAGVTTIPIWPATFLVPIAFSILALLFLVHLIDTLRGEIDDTDEPDEMEMILASGLPDEHLPMTTSTKKEELS